MKSDYEKPSHFRERRAERRSARSDAVLRHQNWYNVEVKIRDVSHFGFMAECADPVQIGSHVSLDVPGIGPVDAQVRWQIGGRMGGMFKDPISLDQFEWAAIKAPPQEAA